MNMELPTFKVLQMRKIKGEGGAHNMRFCETNRIRHDVIFDVIPYVEGSYERAWRKVNPVRLERNEARGGVSMVVFLPHFSGPLVAGIVTVVPLPREWRNVGDGVITVWR